MSESMTYVVTLNVFESITFGKIFGNRAFAATRRAGNDEDMVMICNGHVDRLYRVE